MAQIILTNHVRQRALERGIDISDLDRTVRFPDLVVNSKAYFSKKHIKNFGTYQITVVIKRQGNDWITISTWKSSNLLKNKSIHKQFFLEKYISNLLLMLEKIFSRSS